MNILFTICGRAGSKGIKNKNISIFCGKPLVYYTISEIDLFVKAHPEIKYDIVVSSDSAELMELVSDNKMQNIEKIIRDASLGGDEVGKIDVIRDCMKRMQDRKGYYYDLIVDLDITSPLRTVQDLEKVIKRHVEKKADVTTTVTACRRNPYFNQVKRVEKGVKKVIESNFTARQQAPEIFDMNASIYAYNPAYLMTGNGVLEGYCEIVEMYDTAVLDLDHKNDFELMEVIGKYLFESKEEFRRVYENV